MESKKLFLISSHSGPRLRYVAAQVFERWLGVRVEVVGAGSVLPEGSASIGYGVKAGSVIIPDSGFLKREDFQEPDFDVAKIKTVSSTDFHWNTDILSLIFWSLSRMEEYRKPHLADSHSRFPEIELAAFRFVFQEYPFVDVWVFELAKQLQSLGLDVKTPHFEKEATLDIDNPTAFKHKGLMRNGASILSNFLKGKGAMALQRLQVSFLAKEDPFFTFDHIESVCEILNIKPIHFIWIGDYGPNDKGLHFENPFFRKLIQRITKGFPIGLHPSYQSFNQTEQLLKEKKRLEEITNQPVTKSRQHYLRFRLPETYRQLIEIGIADEYSTGLSGSFGFRAGTSKPFRWYDLENEQETTLTLHPFSMMDSTALHHLKITPEEFVNQSVKIEAALKAVGGTHSVLFHNESFGGKMEWQGWETVFETVMND